MSSTYSSTWTLKRGVELGVANRQRRRVALGQLDVRLSLAALGGHAEHRRARVDADHRPLGADVVEQLGRVEARAAADVEHPFAGLRRERLAHERAAAARVAAAVGDVEPLGGGLVELERAHAATA